jgi:ABC-type nickel/cobalt efflux system permease component RcnA
MESKGLRSRFFAALLLAWVVLAPRAGTAHPLGNFSISHYSGIRIGRDAVEVLYFIDIAEIPTFQEIQETGIVPKASDSGLETYLTRKAEALREGLVLEVNGRRLSLHAESKEIIFPPGAGGLPTMKIGIRYKGRLDGAAPAGLPHVLHYQDRNFSGRAGWKEIIAMPESGVRLLSSTAPEADRSSRLSDYPTDLLNSPPQDLEARVVFAVESVSQLVASIDSPSSGAPAGRIKNDASRTAAPIKKPVAAPNLAADTTTKRSPRESNLQPIALRANRSGTPKDSFTQLVTNQEMGFGMVLVAAIVAAALGALHALEPGHGKTVVAAYLVGSRGSASHALLLGLIVTAAHTGAVYLLGGVTLYASRYVVPERLYPWLGLFSGFTVAGLGLCLFLKRYTGTTYFHSRSHGHHHHSHGHEHSHVDHGHFHQGPNRAVSLRELVALGVMGGIVPCPAALVVLLSAIGLRRVGFGLFLIVAFSIGLAAVLIGLGVLMVYARRFMSRFHGEGPLITRWLPLISAAVITLFGLTMAVQSLATAGIL